MYWRLLARTVEYWHILARTGAYWPGTKRTKGTIGKNEDFRTFSKSAEMKKEKVKWRSPLASPGALKMKRVLYVPTIFHQKIPHLAFEALWSLFICYPSNTTFRLILSVRFDWKYLQYSHLSFQMWKLQDIYVIQILREINFGESRSFKTGFWHFWGSEFWLFGKF